MSNSHTIEINNLLAKVERVANLAKKTIERAERKQYVLSDFSMPSNMQWYVNLRNNHYLHFKFPKSKVMKDREIEVRERIENFKEWDLSLFNLLQLDIEFYIRKNAYWAGSYQYNLI